MTDNDIEQIVRELRKQHPRTAAACDLSDLRRTLAILPESGEWKIAELAPAVFALVPGDALFTVTVGGPDADAQCAVVMTSRTLNGHRLVTRMDWGESLHFDDGTMWRRTQWTFRYLDQSDEKLEEWQRVSGRVRIHPQPEELDNNERYARALLARVGQRVALVEGDELRRTS